MVGRGCNQRFENVVQQFDTGLLRTHKGIEACTLLVSPRRRIERDRRVFPRRITNYLTRARLGYCNPKPGGATYGKLENQRPNACVASPGVHLIVARNLAISLLIASLNFGSTPAATVCPADEDSSRWAASRIAFLANCSSSRRVS